MRRIAFSLGTFNIYWYSIFILLAVVVGFILVIMEAKKEKVDMDKFYDMIFYSLIVGILGARVYYVLFNFMDYIKNPLEIFMLWHGGLAIHGGIIAGGLFILYYTRKHEMNTLKILDILVVGLIIGQAIGRWGNFFNSEAYGSATSARYLEYIHIPKFIIDGMKINGMYFHPTFLYESLWNLVGFITLVLVRRIKTLKLGKLTGIYLAWYSFGRFFIEGMRKDSLMLGSIKMAQLVSIILFIVGLVLIFKKNKEYYHVEHS